MNFIHRLNLNDAEIGQDDIAKFLLAHWRDNKGLKTAEIAKASPFYVLMSGTCIGDLAPSILMTGRRSVTANVLRIEDGSHEKVDDIIGPDYRRFAALSYKEASINREPVLDLVSAEIMTIEGSERVVYERLILPYMTGAGVPHLICYSSLLERHATRSVQGQTIEKNDSRQAINLLVRRSRPEASSI